MTALLQCLSHTPLVGHVDPEQPILVEVNGVIAAAHKRIEAFDPELVLLFLEEAEDLLLSSSEHLTAWEHGEADSLAALQRDLHTLKGGARMAGVTAVGDLAHELENLYEMAGAPNQPAPAPSLFDVLHRGQPAGGHDRHAAQRR